MEQYVLFLYKTVIVNSCDTLFYFSKTLSYTGGPVLTFVVWAYIPYIVNGIISLTTKTALVVVNIHELQLYPL